MVVERREPCDPGNLRPMSVEHDASLLESPSGLIEVLPRKTTVPLGGVDASSVPWSARWTPPAWNSAHSLPARRDTGRPRTVS